MKILKEILIAKYLSGNASQEEINELMGWVNENSVNKEEFDLAKKLWDNSLHLKKERTHNVDEALNDLLERAKEQTPIKNRSFKLQPLQIAASLLLLISLLLIVKFFTSKAEGKNVISVNQELVASEKEMALIITIATTDSVKAFFLPDSSRIFLNKHSKLSYPEKFSSTERSTALSGEAFFEIQPSSVPFVISCKQTKTTVVGTSFNIRGYDADKKIIVSVVTGTVHFSDNQNGSVTLKANERATFDGENASLSKTNYTDNNFSWRKKTSLKTRIKKIINKIKDKIN